MLTARGLDGVKVKIVLEASWAMVPDTPGATVKLAALMVATFMASLKVAERKGFSGTLIPWSTGKVESTRGPTPPTPPSNPSTLSAGTPGTSQAAESA